MATTANNLSHNLYIGLMSGTSLDGVDGVLVDFSGSDGSQFKVLAHAYAPFPAHLRQEFMALNSTGPDEIHRAALAANALVRIYAAVVGDLLGQSGSAANSVTAIGAHGQTVRHRPQEFDGTGYTVQLNNAALLAELTGIDVVADFRSRDVAAGGQGAPLVPAFHGEVFGRAGEAIAVLNIGGISNVSLIPAQDGESDSAPTEPEVLGFDCGPGNALMDYWCQQHTGHAFDAGGMWAAQGSVHPELLAHLLAEPYFAKTPPKSTGRDLFNVPWLQARLSGYKNVAAVDVQTTLTELTARSCAMCVISFQKHSKSLLVCGGGALNTYLMARLQHDLPGVPVASTDAFGLPPLQVEATAFAWLARKAIRRETGNLPTVTGATNAESKSESKSEPKGAKKGTDGARILGAVYPR
jgi:anhydro-N-acetylmuramic acid kinase